ncbi:MAG: prepilin peptidase [Gemmatimonadetes bacterium]|nr:prepilin peptidase [Gemmatimonadota bacterium]
MLESNFGVLAAALFGSLIGSFLNVCIVRLPANESVVAPRSRCPQCRKVLAAYDNIPVLSWIVLGGKCRSCSKPIPVRYPLVELAVAVVFGTSFWYYGFSVEAGRAALFGTLLLGIGVTDARAYIIPDEFTWGGLGAGLAFSWVHGFAGFLDALLGAAVGFGLLYFIAWAGEMALKKEAMGGGDIKMMVMVGSFLGWQGVLMTLFGGALIGTLVFGPVTLVKKGLLVPFGVFLAAAAAVTFVIGDDILRWYLGFLTGR